MPAALAASALLLFACAPDPGSSPADARDLTVFAASSLTAAFTQIGTDFEAANPGTQVTFDFGPSDGLAGQIASEGVADVFASASQAWMDDVAANVGVSARTDFVTNELVIITPADDPAGVSSLRDLARPGLQLILATEGVPVGDYARQVLDDAGIADDVLANVVSSEEDDAAVVARIAGGEADAAVVYVSDVHGDQAAELRQVPLPRGVNVVVTYPIAVVEGAGNADLARAWIDFVVSGEGQTRLVEEFGFLPSG